jgi:hypothetical protein
MQIPPELPRLAEQIAWVRDRAADAEEFRQLLVRSGHVNAEKAAHDAEMWKAVLSTLQTIYRTYHLDRRNFVGRATRAGSPERLSSPSPIERGVGARTRWKP